MSRLEFISNKKEKKVKEEKKAPSSFKFNIGDTIRLVNRPNISAYGGRDVGALVTIKDRHIFAGAPSYSFEGENFTSWCNVESNWELAHIGPSSLISLGNHDMISREVLQRAEQEYNSRQQEARDREQGITLRSTLSERYTDFINQQINTPTNSSFPAASGAMEDIDRALSVGESSDTDRRKRRFIHDLNTMLHRLERSGRGISSVSPQVRTSIEEIVSSQLDLFIRDNLISDGGALQIQRDSLDDRTIHISFTIDPLFTSPIRTIFVRRIIILHR